MLLFFAALTFVPTRYLYPSKKGGRGYVRSSSPSASLWVALLLVILWQWSAAPPSLVVASLAFPMYYVVASWVISIRLSQAPSFRVNWSACRRPLRL